MDNSKIKPDMHAFMRDLVKESLRDWFKKEKWVRITTAGNIAGPCGTSKNTKNPDRCLPKAKAQSLTKAQRAATARKKKKAGAKGKTVVKNTKAATVKKESKEKWPETYYSARADEYEYRRKELLSSGRAKYNIIDLVNSTIYDTIIFDTVDDLKAHADDLIKPQGGRQSSHFGTNETANPQDGKAAPYGSGYGPVTKENFEALIRETVKEYLSEKNVPTDKAKWNYYKSQAKKKFDTYPSAYANGWAAKKYKAAGGGWRKETKKSK